MIGSIHLIAIWPIVPAAHCGVAGPYLWVTRDIRAAMYCWLLLRKPDRPNQCLQIYSVRPTQDCIFKGPRDHIEQNIKRHSNHRHNSGIFLPQVSHLYHHVR